MIKGILHRLNSLSIVAWVLFTGLVQAQIPNRIIVNPSFEIPNISSPGICTAAGGTTQRYLPDSSYSGTNEANKVPGWRTTDDPYNSTAFNCPTFSLPYRPVEYFRTPTSGSAADGQQWAELNAEFPRRLYQNVCLVAGESVPFTYSHRARFDAGIETARAAIYAADGVTLISAGPDTTATSTSTWNIRSGTLTNTGPSGLYQYGFEARIGAGGTPGVIGSGRANEGNFLDNIRITLRPLADINRFVDSSGNTLSSVGESAGTVFLEVIINGTVQGSGAIITLTRSGVAATADFSVGSSTNRPGATASANANGDITLNIPAGEYDPNAATGSQIGAIRIPITITNDSAVEGSEPLTYTIASVSNPGAPAGADLVTNINGQSARCTTAVVNTTLTIRDEADLAVEKTGPASVAQGSTVTYTIKVWNRGPTAVSSANFSDSVPSSLTGVTWTCTASGSAACGSSSGTGNSISVTTGALPVNTAAANPTSGSYLTFTVSGTASSAGSLPNTASISPPVGVIDPSSGNNSSTATTQVTPPPPSISGTVYNDNNGNSSLDVGEPRLANVQVELLNSGGTVIATQSTDAQGNYTFTGIAPGTYTVRVSTTDPDLPPGSTLTTPNNLSVTVPAGSAVTNQNFGFRRRALDVIKSAGLAQQVASAAYVVPYTIVVGNTGQLSLPNVQVTENLSQTFPGSSSITLVAGSLNVATGGGATCTLNSAFNGTSDTRLLSGSNTLNAGQSCTISFSARVTYASAGAVPTVPQNNTAYGSSTPSGPNPGYSFPGGTPTPPSGALATDASTNSANPASPAGLPSTPGGDSPSATPVTLTPNPGSIRGTLYNDQNNNGSFDSLTEPRLPANIEVQLLDSSNNVIATTQTDANGEYAFPSVAPGSYTVRAVATDPQVPTNLAPSAPSSGAAPVTVTAGAPTTQDFGFQKVVIDVIKSAGTPVQINPTTYEVPIAVVVGNTGNVLASNVQVSENLSRTFSAGSPTISLVGTPALVVTPSSGATCTANPSFNGTSVFGLLSGTDDLAPGQNCTIRFTVRLVYPSTAAIPSAPQNNQVFASSLPGSGPNPGHTFPGGVPTPPPGASATDTSSNTTHPASPAGLPSTPGGDTPGNTPITLPNPGSISGTLYLDQNNNNAFDPGTDPRLPNVSVELVDSGGNVVSTTQTDGNGDYSFTGVIPSNYTVRVVASDLDLGGATPSAPPSGTRSVSVSPGTASTNQNFGFSRTGLDVLKSAAAPVQVDARTFTITYTVVAGNTGTTPLPNVQLTENLAQTFATNSPTITIISAPAKTAGSAPCTPNPSFDGTSDTRLLSGSDTFQGGQNCTIVFTVRVQYADASAVPSAPQNNSVYASSTPTGPNPGYSFPGGTPTPPAGATATDTSTNTTNPASPGALPGTPGGDTPSTTPVSLVTNLGSISGTLYNDLNGNKSFDGTPQDARLGAGITVELVDASGSVVSTTTTDANGNYSFNAVAPGTYTIRVPTGSSNPALGTLQPVAPTSAQITGVNIAPGTAANNRNFGFNNPPVAQNDSATTPFNTPVTFSAVGNDSDPDGFVDPATIDLDPSTLGDQKTRTVPGQGTFSVDASGNVTFTPEPTFSGTATIPYTLRDNTGNTSNQANLSVTVQPPQPPVAVNDDASTLPGTPVTIDPKTNDSTPNQGASIVPGSVVFPATGQPAGSTRSPDGKTLTVPGQGTYSINPDGTVTFSPVPTFVGTATPVTYTFQDSTGQTSNPATITVDISSPAAVDDNATTPFNTPVTLDPKTNDLVASGRTLNPSSVVFPPSGQPAGSTRSPDGKTLTVPGEGTYQIQPDGTVTFTPSPTFTGTTSPVQYTIADDAGAVSSPASIRVTVGPPAPPVANPDTATTPFGAPVTLNPPANDTAGPGTTLVPGSIDLDPSTPGQQTTRTVPGQGRFDLNPTTGQVTFTPEPGFAGTVQIPYTIQDNLGQTSPPSTLTVNVTPPPAPVARDDAKAGDFNQPVTVPAVLNDSPSPGTTLVPGSIDLDPSTPGQETTRTIPGKGTFTVQPDGTVRFDPVPGFEGTAVVPYTIKDNLGQTSNPANIAVTIRPRPAPPTARDDSATTPKGTPVTLDAVANDSANLPNAIDPASIDLDPSTPGRQTTFTVPGRGTFEAEPDGKVVFTPVPGFTGTVTIPYTVADQDNDPNTSPQTSNPANLTVTVNE
ncbi:SdrD B-like domain-containing protein, partial [Meiothermus sp.]|uniref:SdrD B-like domain-containing protein n=1 Tax=Meiothermus sp. TaxID=1955249 RepID=UPI00307EFE99